MISTPLIPNLDYDHVYEPAEDTFLFLDLFESLHEKGYFHSKNFTNKTPIVLEIGSGSGVISTFVSQHKIVPNSINLASDINLIALETTKRTHSHNRPVNEPFDIVRSDLTNCFRSNQIDVLFFNPPYVPSEDIPSIPNIEDDSNSAWLDLALVGGDNGMLITNKVLDKLDTTLSLNGEAYILFCARNNHPKVISQFKQENENFNVELVIERKCGWEELAIYRFTKLQ